VSSRVDRARVRLARLFVRNRRLRESEEQFRRVFADAPAGMLILGASGIIQGVNAAYCRDARSSEEELVGSSFLELVYPEEREKYARLFEERLAGSVGHPVERRFRAKDGTEVWAIITMSVITGDARVVHVQNMTEERHIRLELEQRNVQLLAADREKDELISVVSHELRTPLTSIMGYLELVLTEGEEGGLSDVCRDFLLVAQRNSQRLQRLVEDLLFVSSAEAGRATLALGAIDLAAVVRDAVDAALPSASAGGVALSVSGEAGGTAIADVHRVAEVIENLLSNAVKFTPQGGRVDVEVSSDVDTVAVRVLDTGRGIAEQDARRLFERFFRASDAEGLPGAGLGLSIAKAIVEAHGGSIGVESREGEGTSFEVRLRRSGPAALTPAAVAAA
jgi:PAS domain S-box-containing protein